MKLILTFTLLFLSSCFFSEDGKIEINPLNSSFGTSNAQVSSVSIVNDQLVVNGSGLSGITKVQITGPSSFDHTFSIESASDSNLIANGVSNIAFALDAIFSLTVTDANGSATYSVTFTLQDDAVTTSKILDGAVTAAKLSDMGAGTGQVLKYNGTTWVPGDLNALTYAGTWDASTATAPNVAPAAGEYYIVSVAAAGIDISDGSGLRNFVLGDWLVYNGTTTRWDKIDNASYVTSFNGRSGAVTPATNDYTWAQIDKSASVLSNINDVEAPAGDGSDTGKVLKWNNATSTWELGDDLSGGGAGSVTSTEIANGSITNDDVNAAAAIAYSKLNIADGDLTIAKTSGLQTTLDAKLPLAGGTMTGNIVMSGAQTVDGVDVSTLATSVSTNTSTIAGLDTDDITEATNQYFTNARAIAAPITGFTSGAGTVAATDTVLQAIQKLDGNVTALDTDDVTEATNLYFTDARAKASAVVNSTAGTETDQAASVSAMKTYVAAQVSGAGAVLADGSVAMTGNLDLGNNQLRLKSDNTNYVQMIAPNSLAATYTLTMPADDGTSGQVLSTNGTGTLSWVSPASGSVTSVTGTAPIVSSGGTTPAISIAQANGSTDGFLDSADWTTFNNKQAAITTGTTAQYLRGDLSLSTFSSDVIGSAITGFTSGAGTVAATDTVLQAVQKLDGNIAANTSTISGLDTDDITEATNQYFTNARAIAAPITGFTSGAGTVAATDTVLQAIQKLDGNIAANTSSISSSGDILDGGNTTGSAVTIGTNDAQSLNLETNNTTAMTILSGGNVGVGTASPGTSLHVYHATTNTVARFESGDANANITLADNSTTNIPYIQATANDLILGHTSGGDQFSLTAAGNVGIGTTSPNRLLEVAGPVRVTAAALPGSPATGDIAIDSGDANKLKWYNGSAWQEAGGTSGAVTSVTGTAPIVSSGGTTPAISIAQANGSTDGFLDSADWTTFNNKQAAITTGTTAQYLRGDLSLSTFSSDVIGSAITGFTSGAGTVAATDTVLQAIQKLDGNIAASGDILDGGNTNGAAVTIGTNDAQSLNLETNNSTAMTILSGGNVGIGTTSPAFDFVVSNAGNGGLEIAPDYSAGATALQTYDRTAAAYDRMDFIASDFLFRPGGVNAVAIDSSGNVGIGTTSPNSSALLDVTSTTKGFLPPRMTTTQRAAISTPAEGLIVFDTTENSLYLYSSSSWSKLTDTSEVVFRVHRNGTDQSIPATTATDIDWTNEDFDTDSAFDLTTDRFTPTKAGYYLIRASVAYTDIAANGLAWVYILKNGSTVGYNGTLSTSSTNDPSATSSQVVYLNGTTDYVSFQAYHSHGSSRNLRGGASYTNASGFLISGGTGGGGSDHLGNHTATQNVQLGANYISNDGGASEGLSFDTSGNATFTGTVTGTTFSGSGASLTNIPTAAIDNNAITVDKVDFASSNGINIPQVASAPGSPTTGQMYFNTSDSKLYIYNGTSWEEVGSGSGSGTEVAFSVHKNDTDQTVTTNTWTLLTWSTEEFDTNSNFASNRFTPTVAGKYFIGGSGRCTGNTSWCYLAIYKNGTRVRTVFNNVGDILVNINAVIDLNGTTDYVELYARNTGGTNINGSTNSTFFHGALVGAGGAGSDNLGNHTAGQNIVLGSHYLSGDGGNEGISVDSTGNVGIGTTTPSTPLHVYGTSGDQRARIETTDAAGDAILFLKSSDADAQISYERTGANTGDLKFEVDNAGVTEAMRITSSGNVGIGTTSPKARLHLDNPSSFGTPPASSGTTPTGEFILETNDNAMIEMGTMGSSPWGGWLRVTDSSNLGTNYPFILQPNGGNVGIGTTSPSRKLEVLDSSNLQYRATANGTTYWDFGRNVSTGDFEIADDSLGAVLTIDQVTGNLGIGTASPTSLLHIRDGSANSDVGIKIGNDARDWNMKVMGSSSDSFQIFTHDNSNVMTILSSGSVGIGDTTPGYKLDVNGTIRGFGITDSSDERLKNTIEPLENSLDKIRQLEGVSYFWNEDIEERDEDLQIGLIAQKVEMIYPELVETDDSGMKSVNYSHLVAPLIEATKEVDNNLKMFKLMQQGIDQEQNRRIAALEEKNKELENQVNELKAVVCSIKPEAKMCQ